ncbi:MAG: type II toxin-antitoxin system RelE/ParE family toxin [Cyclobacteriaceae bacterium]|nr:type II toxin-antitoxin system RelE/ParE family toxin [Cyclobacteriaceae bacterium]
MELEIIWSKRAAAGYAKILKFLDEQWSQKEVENFEQEVKKFLKNLSKQPYMLKGSEKMGFRRGPINKLTMLTYRIIEKKNQLQLINIRGSRQKPLI